jgi:hypothetical protein
VTFRPDGLDTATPSGTSRSKSYHQCSGKVVAVLSSTYSHERKAWYITVLCRQDEIVPGYTPGEEFWEELPPATPYS